VVPWAEQRQIEQDRIISTDTGHVGSTMTHPLRLGIRKNSSILDIARSI